MVDGTFVRIAQGVTMVVLAACAGGGQAAEESVPGVERGALAPTEEAKGRVTGASGVSEVPAAPAAEQAADLPPGHARLVVTVEWQDAPAVLRRAAGRSPCGHPRRASLGIHTLGGVGEAVVWLGSLEEERESERGRAESRTAAVAPMLTVRDCRMEPRVLVLTDVASRHAPALRVRNAGEKRQRVAIHPFAGARDRPTPHATEVWLPVAGTQLAVPIAKPGIWLARGELDPDVPSYIVAASHSHLAMTNERGVATLPSVPGGEYQLRIWYPPVKADGPPVEIRRSVDLQPGKVTTLEVSLAPGK